jgi:RNA polymerase sigma-70 factor, ECF subfamily
MLTDTEVLDFYERTSPEVYRYASRLVGGDRQRAEDLLQDTYLTLVRQVRAGTIHAVEIGWAITACRSRFLDQMRRSGTEERSRVRSLTIGNADTNWPGDVAVGATEALARLSDAQRLVLVLRYIDDMTVDDVAATIGRSVRATESLLVRARQALRTEYERGQRGAS